MNTQDLSHMAQKARETFNRFSLATPEKKNEALECIAQTLLRNKAAILEANLVDLQLAKDKGSAPYLLDRLSLQDNRLERVVEDLRHIISLEDPVGELLEKRTMTKSGITIVKKRVPIGVLGIIYEARPNVTIDVAALCIKTGNVAILRGGSETLNSNLAIEKAIGEGLIEASLSKDIIQLIKSPERSQVLELLKMDRYIDMIIPRGGASLHRFCVENSTIPVITGGIGICHLFVDDSADLELSIPVIINAKTQRPSVCNALDTLLVHEKIAKNFLPKMAHELIEKGVHLKLDAKALEYLDQKVSQEFLSLAEPEDWDTEWLGLTLGIKVVHSLTEAIYHIQRHSSGHSDGILTSTPAHGDLFAQAVDSAAIYINASTRFTDGGEFGLGAEVAVSTQKLHARGPMGLKELTSYKWIVQGNYSIRA